MQNKQELKQIIRESMEKYDLYGRSFTYGLALYKLIRNNWISERNDRYGIEERMTAFIGEDVIETMENRGLLTTMSVMVEMIRIEDLDEIAKELVEE